VRRKPGILLSIEIAILRAGIDLMRTGSTGFYGYAIAKEIRDQESARRLTAHGTLYRALERMEKAGFLRSRWEDPSLAASEERPRRRLYEITAEGEAALAAALQQTPQPKESLKRGLAPS
jgi:DNA-binding PadR family transcriptional regulator